MRATAWKAKVIEHDLSVGRHFYRRPSPVKVAVTTCGSYVRTLLQLFTRFVCMHPTIRWIDCKFRSLTVDRPPPRADSKLAY